jgi:hypothetical protein
MNNSLPTFSFKNGLSLVLATPKPKRLTQKNIYFSSNTRGYNDDVVTGRFKCTSRLVLMGKEEIYIKSWMRNLF